MSHLHKPTVLVLNRNWLALTATSPAEVLGAMLNEQVTGLDIQGPNWMTPVSWPDWQSLPIRESDTSIGTTHGRIRIPTVVILRTFDRVPRKRLKFSLQGLFQRDGGRCQYTGRRLKLSEANIDHVLPSSRGGPTTWENCVLSDKKVNTRKADRTPREAGLKLLRQPLRPPEIPITYSIKNKHQIQDWAHFLPAS